MARQSKSRGRPHLQLPVRASLRSFFAQAFGLTDSSHPYVYLSDGGHFENLGLYKMILRRCRFIVVLDAGQDAELNFEDLGNALSKIRVDLGLPIKFGKIPLHARPVEPQKDSDRERGGQAGHCNQSYCAIARICYSCVAPVPAAKDGLLLYIKPALNGTKPADVFSYAAPSAIFAPTPSNSTTSRNSKATASSARTSCGGFSSSFPPARRSISLSRRPKPIPRLG